MIRFFFLAALAVFVLKPTAAATVSLAPKRGGTLQFGLDGDILSINPFQRTLSTTKHVGSIAFECLLTVDKNEQIQPALATSWETSKDGLEYIFKLRKGVKFHTGKEMTAEDVIWSIEYASTPQNRAYGRTKLLAISSLDAPDPLTLRIVLREPYVPFLAGLATGFDTFPVVPKGSVPSGSKRMAMYPPGTGPFVMTDYKPNRLIAFKRFDEYWQKGLPYLDAIEFRLIEDSVVRFTALRTGALDVAARIGYEYGLRILKGEIEGLSLKYSPTNGYRAWIFNTGKPPFDNPKLRQAAAHAIDKAKIIEGVSFGLGSVHNQKIQKASPWYVDRRDRERDLAKARALLEQAGYPNGLRVKARVSRGWPNPEVTQIIQSQLKDIGIRVDIELVDFAKAQQENRTGQFQMGPMGGTTYIDPDLAYYQYFHTEKGPIKNSNFSRYSNPQMDKLLEHGRKEPDFQKRYRIYKKVVEILHDDVPQITLGFTPYLFAARKSVRAFELQAQNNDYYYVVGGLGMTWLEK